MLVGNQPPLVILVFQRFFSISGVSSFMRASRRIPLAPSLSLSSLPLPVRRSLAPRLQEKLTFKPAIKKEKCEIFDFSGASYPRRQLVDAYNPRGNLISLISQAKHVRTSPPFRNLRFSCICSPPRRGDHREIPVDLIR